MMEQNQLAVYQNFDSISKAAIALQKSGYFTDVKSEAQAIVKVMAGAELGLPPFASMAGIHIIQGKPALGSNVIATLVKNDPRYNYRVVSCDNKSCVIDWYEEGVNWYEEGVKVGKSEFTMDDATMAGLTNNPSWKKFPSDMLFARAITRGARRYAPGIFGGSPIYTPEELGVDTDEEGYIDSKSYPVNDEPVSLIAAAAELGGVVAEPSHDWESMTTGEIAGRLNEYIKRLKADPNDEDALKKRDEAKYWLEKKNGTK